MISYRFQVIQTSRDLSLSIFMLLEPHGLSFRQNEIYTGGKLNPLPFDEKSITDKSQHKKNLGTNKSTLFPIQNQWTSVQYTR